MLFGKGFLKLTAPGFHNLGGRLIILIFFSFPIYWTHHGQFHKVIATLEVSGPSHLAASVFSAHPHNLTVDPQNNKEDDSSEDDEGLSSEDEKESEDDAEDSEDGEEDEDITPDARNTGRSNIAQ